MSGRARGPAAHALLPASGTALGDYTAIALHLGYLASVVVFGVAITVPALARWGFGVNAVVAFWSAYVITRPLGASVADYLSKPKSSSGVGFGDGPSTAVFAVAVLVLVAYLSWTRVDVQRPEHHPLDPSSAT